MMPLKKIYALVVFKRLTGYASDSPLVKEW